MLLGSSGYSAQVAGQLGLGFGFAHHFDTGGVLHELATATTKRMLFYCAFGERSAMAVQAAQDAGITTACHIQGGIDAWKKAGEPLTR